MCRQIIPISERVTSTVEPGIWKHRIWKLGSIRNTIVVKTLLISSNMLTLLATLKFLALLWKLETAFQSIFLFPDSRFQCTVFYEYTRSLSTHLVNTDVSTILMALKPDKLIFTSYNMQILPYFSINKLFKLYSKESPSFFFVVKNKVKIKTKYKMLKKGIIKYIISFYRKLHGSNSHKRLYCVKKLTAFCSFLPYISN
jgi:hypothetical protein